MENNLFSFPEKYKPTLKNKKKKKYIPKLIEAIQNYTPIEIDYTFQKNISYSQFSMFNECPKKWSLNYVEGHKTFNSTIHTVFGTALHEALQHYLTIMYEKSGAEADREDILGIFEEALRKEYKKQYVKNNNSHFSTPEELGEFFEDGEGIINHIVKNRSKYFSKRGWYLVACELPITLTPNHRFKRVIYQGYLDVVLFHEPTGVFHIIDLKTSTRGWNDKAKKDENKQFQLILYKKFFSEMFGINLDKIKIEFFILKRKVYDHPEYNIPKIQRFSPPSGKIKLGKASKALEKFITEAFDQQGYKDADHKPIINNNCHWCPFYKTKLCSVTYEE